MKRPRDRSPKLVPFDDEARARLERAYAEPTRRRRTDDERDDDETPDPDGWLGECAGR